MTLASQISVVDQDPHNHIHNNNANSSRSRSLGLDCDGGSQENSTNNNARAANGESGNVWNSLLRECLHSAVQEKRVKRILMLGRSQSGRRSLLEKLDVDDDIQSQSHSQSHRQSKPERKTVQHGLNYLPLTFIQDEEKLHFNAWITNYDSVCLPFFQFGLDANNIEDCLVMITLDLSQPWTLMNELLMAFKSLTRHTDTINLDLSPEAQTSARDRIVNNYRIFGQDSNVLTNNLGIPIMVVGTKSDATLSLDTLNEDQYDYIQVCLRKECMKYGASLVYTSTVSDRNIDVLSSYISSVMHGKGFDIDGANILQRDGVFVPSGWDSYNKVNLVLEHTSAIDTSLPFEKIIQDPTLHQCFNDKIVKAQDDQKFLKTHYDSMKDDNSISSHNSVVENKHVMTQTRTTCPSSPETSMPVGQRSGGDQAKQMFNTLNSRRSTSTTLSNSPPPSTPPNTILHSVASTAAAAAAAAVNLGEKNEEITNFFKSLAKSGSKAQSPNKSSPSDHR